MWQNSKTQIVKKLKNQIVTKLKLWPNSKNCENTLFILFFFLQNSKTQIVTKHKNTNCDKTQKIKLGQNSKTQIVNKFKKKTQIATKLKKFKLWQASKTQIVTKLKKSNYVNWKNPAYGRQSISRPKRIVAPIPQ